MTTRCSFGETLWRDIDAALHTLELVKDDEPEKQKMAREVVDGALSAYFHHKSGRYEYSHGKPVREITPPCFDCELARRAVALRAVQP